jgi:peptidoglycan/LPS O-acetylase OafA/YrhL
VRRRGDRVSIVAGLAVGGLGVLLLLDTTGLIDLGFAYGLPAILACVGAILLAAGLEGPRR